MSEEEVYDLLLKESAFRYAAWQHGEQPNALEGAPTSAASSIKEGLWYAGARHVGSALLSAGATQQQVIRAYQKLKETLEIIEPHELASLPADLVSAIANDLQQALNNEPIDRLSRIDEKFISEISEHRIDIYLNENQHRGRPHVVVTLPDGKISVSLEDTPEVLTPHGYRGEASARKVVKKHLSRLLEIWNETRPDDQRLD